MLPSRGLRPAQFTPLASRPSAILRSNATRKFSSLPRTSRLSCPSGPLQSVRRSTVSLNASSSVRHGSWYAPWSWGKSSSPVDSSVATSADQVPIAEFSHRPVSQLAHDAVPSVTTATPELAPAAIDKAAVVDGAPGPADATTESAATMSDPKTLDELFGLDPVKDTLPTHEIDPTRLIDHAGQLQELGLDYGWGMTTLFEKCVETIYLQSGWGWAGTIVAACVAVRGTTFFLQAMSSDRMAAMAAMKPITQPIQEKMEAAIASGDKEKEKMYRTQQQHIMKPYVGGMLSVGGFMFMQGWIGFSAFRFLRGMSELPVPGMAQDGFLWFTDLTVRDPYYILPVATTTVMYIVFKTGGETGVQNDVGQAAHRQKLFTGLAFFLGLVTAFQASGLQLYFLTTGILGGITGWLLRQNRFRELIRIRKLPSQQSNEFYTKVAKGQLALPSMKSKDGRVNHLPPSPVRRAIRRQVSDIRVKAGTAIPAHLKSELSKTDTESPGPDRDNQGPNGKPLSEKLDDYRSSYRISSVRKRIEDWVRKTTGYGGSKITQEQQRRKKRAEEYEIERRRRFENRS
ncbi:mitochondrial export translocase Oxa1 [Decorospora gaudefroyi]|uniref:Mitochondrial export translocase Oxa1 n=1 Tax=Decorospora gaudefroyi TaxID=184978 RepID=A0A6A5K8F9_9PLEO|nr:mitochondrial export translocase Oxa1 [Decorospora gaudefroyi]